MKRTKKLLAAVAVVCGFLASAVAPWWAVWFICFPVIYAGAVILLEKNIKTY